MTSSESRDQQSGTYRCCVVAVLSVLQALPRRHPILASFEADRAARQAASGISTDTLTAAGAEALLPHESAASVVTTAFSRIKQPRSALQQSRGNPHCSSLLQRSGDGDVVAGRGKEDLVFCSNNWLVQVDKRTGGCMPVIAWVATHALQLLCWFVGTGCSERTPTT